MITHEKQNHRVVTGGEKPGSEVRETAKEGSTQFTDKLATQLDKPANTERPWTPRGSSIPGAHRSGDTGIRTVDERFVVVDGPAARVLQAEQTRALHAVLAWLADHPEPGTTGSRRRSKKSSTRNDRKGRG
jgi:hypothetical protein